MTDIVAYLIILAFVGLWIWWAYSIRTGNGINPRSKR